jgi:hypothetical protein
LRTAEVFFQSVTTADISPVSENEKLISVLEICAEQMISKWEFGNVPMDVIPPELHEALYSLLDEELIIRLDAASAESISTTSETINFTFDEFRDFMLSQYLVRKLFVNRQNEFDEAISKADPAREQPTEGLKRFLFYAARNPKNARCPSQTPLPDTAIFVRHPSDRTNVVNTLTRESIKFQRIFVFNALNFLELSVLEKPFANGDCLCSA